MKIHTKQPQAVPQFKSLFLGVVVDASNGDSMRHATMRSGFATLFRFVIVPKRGCRQRRRQTTLRRGAVGVSAVLIAETVQCLSLLRLFQACNGSNALLSQRRRPSCRCAPNRRRGNGGRGLNADHFPRCVKKNLIKTSNSRMSAAVPTHVNVFKPIVPATQPRLEDLLQLKPLAPKDTPPPFGRGLGPLSRNTGCMYCTS